ncbi:MAG: hypothetical protein V4472_05300 [Pseudomonadota bacterium]
MDLENQIAPQDGTLGARKSWETPTFERYDARRETKGKYATVTEFTTTTGPGS